MERLLKALKPRGVRRGPRQHPVRIRIGDARHRRPGRDWMVHDLGTPDADDLRRFL